MEKLLDEALTENRIVCFHKIDQPLVTKLCAIIGHLYRKCEAAGLRHDQINEDIELAD